MRYDRAQEHVRVMKRSHSARRGLLGGYVLLTAFVVAHSVNAFLEYSLEARRWEPAPLTPQASVDVAHRDPTVLMESVLTSRLFPLPADAALVSVAPGIARQSRPHASPLDVSKKLVLLGTVDSSDGAAILEDVSSKQQSLYHLNDTVSSVGTIVEIERDRVLFRNKDQEEWLNIAIETLRPGFASDVEAVPAAPAPSSARSVHPSPSRRKKIDRQLLVDADNNSAHLFVHGQPSPFLIDGRPQGIVLDGVNFFGFYGKLGLLTGDVLKRVNGLELQDPTRLPSIVHLLKNEQTFTLDILRNGKPLTLTYDVA
jgi:general secretion pathway protein C